MDSYQLIAPSIKMFDSYLDSYHKDSLDSYHKDSLDSYHKGSRDSYHRDSRDSYHRDSLNSTSSMASVLIAPPSIAPPPRPHAFCMSMSLTRQNADRAMTLTHYI
jgi:hypothetical protein